MAEWLAGRPAARLADQLTGWLPDWLTTYDNWVERALNDWLTDRLLLAIGEAGETGDKTARTLPWLARLP